MIGGSPCTYWSIAQKNNRETEASGMGWELFSQYVRALHEAKPKFFVYENNKSMAKAIRESIDKAFGFEAIGINSALVSAQNRQRLYWVGKRNDDGTYSKVNVEQPEDRGILLKDILDSGCAWQDKSYAYTTWCNAAIPNDTLEKHRHTMVAEPANPDGAKAKTVTSSYYKYAASDSFKKANPRMGVAEPVRIPEYGSEDKSRPVTACYAYKGCGEGSLATEAFPDNPNKQVRDYVAEPVNMTADGKAQCVRATCYKDGIRNIVGNDVDKKTGVAEPIKVGEVGNGGQGNRIYSVDGKSVAQTAQSGGIGSNTGLYAIPVEFDGDIPVKAISAADGKTYTVYVVKDGQITIKGKQYPIKLIDGYYIIRKLTVKECMRLQTVPEWYEFPVSDSQAYKMLGNGWTVEVITHLLRACK